MTTLTIDGRQIEINNERNLLEVIRNANIELPTFCYHSELSVYGACRLCLVDVGGQGLVSACSAIPQDNMQVKTNTPEIREIRKIIVELLLANHSKNCTTCAKSTNCQLQTLARQLGIETVRFKPIHVEKAIDCSSESLVRDPNKCILCGDCVRMCAEVQGIGAIDFAYRGASSAVLPAFGKDLGQVNCVNCGQCARVCPTGALTPKPQIENVWRALLDPSKTVIVQVAPAVRVALGESFGFEPGTTVSGQMVSALRMLGFDKVFDTSFTADLTVLEEANEFLTRFQSGQNLPLFTSCCPAWVKFVEQYYPKLLDHLSTCKSPQQMFGSMAKRFLPDQLKIDRKNLVVVSIMPCTAKKFEAKRSEFITNGDPDIDFVLTTQELAKMIEEAGIQFKKLQPESFDLPFGFKTGAGVVFGNSGGVTEAVLRYVSELVTDQKTDSYEFLGVRGESGIREYTLMIGDKTVKMAIVHSLGHAKQLLADMEAQKIQYDFIEVMACPGGCINGAGQPVSESTAIRSQRTEGLYKNDRMLQLHKSQQNPYITELYHSVLEKPNSHTAHELLHTQYQNRQRIQDQTLNFFETDSKTKIKVQVCVGTSCYIRGSQQLLKQLMELITSQQLTDQVSISASFCFERCNKGPTVTIQDKTIEKCTFEQARDTILSYL